MGFKDVFLASNTKAMFGTAIGVGGVSTAIQKDADVTSLSAELEVKTKDLEEKEGRIDVQEGFIKELEKRAENLAHEVQLLDDEIKTLNKDQERFTELDVRYDELKEELETLLGVISGGLDSLPTESQIEEPFTSVVSTEILDIGDKLDKVGEDFNTKVADLTNKVLTLQNKLTGLIETSEKTLKKFEDPQAMLDFFAERYKEFCKDKPKEYEGCKNHQEKK